MSDAIANARKELDDLVDAARLCLANRRELATLVLSYTGIDAAAALTAENPKAGVRANFVHWVDSYLLPCKPLKVTALGLYAARCGVLHSLTARSDLSEAGKARRLLYGWGKGDAEVLERINVAGGFTDRYAAVQVEDLINGLAGGIAAVFDGLEHDAGLRARVEERGTSFYTRVTPTGAAEFATWLENLPWSGGPTGGRQDAGEGPTEQGVSSLRRRMPMDDPLEGEFRRAPTWDTLEKAMHSWLVARFGLNRPVDKDIWLFCIGTAMELERLAVAVLWIADGRPGPFPEYEDKMTLGQAHHEIEKRGLLDAATRKVLRNVADLRNSVAHRHAIFVTAPSPVEGHPTGEYGGSHVFMDPEALDGLMQDFDTGAQAMYAWMVAKAPDLAEEARRSGAHPIPP